MIIDATELRRLSGYQRPSDVERWCRTNGVAYKPTRAGPITTTEALNQALGVVPVPQDETYRADLVA